MESVNYVDCCYLEMRPDFFLDYSRGYCCIICGTMLHCFFHFMLFVLFGNITFQIAMDFNNHSFVTNNVLKLIFTILVL